MSSQTVLVVDDDPLVREVVVDCLEDAHFTVLQASNGQDGLAVAHSEQPSVVILDLSLPDMEGLTLAHHIRQSNPGAGVIILSGRSAAVERVIGLEVGADDYICKPFEPRELLARVRSVLRRMSPQSQPTIAPVNQDCFQFSGCTLDVGAVALTGPDGANIPLSSSEFSLLKAFVEKPNRVLSRDQLIDLTHTNDAPAFDRSVDVQVARLRKKIDLKPDQPSLIKTIRNQGYLFSANVRRA